MEFLSVKLHIPDGANLILGQSHFIKTVEDLYEVMVTNVPGGKFGVAFSEASGPCLVRAEGNDNQLKMAAIYNIRDIACGHSFCIVMRDCFPINVLNAVKACPEVANVFCATANPVEVIVCRTEQGQGIMGVIDGFPPKGVEGPEDVADRKNFLRKIGYKL
ncbi:MAG: adenosine-specific kinase [Nitrospirae bacterium]|nr:adenosine-specific kinase [Nitrospirota bacterium]